MILATALAEGAAIVVHEQKGYFELAFLVLGKKKKNTTLLCNTG